MANDSPDLIQAGRTELKSIASQLDDATNRGFRTENGGLVVADEKVVAEMKGLLAKGRTIRGNLAVLEGKSLIGADGDPSLMPIGSPTMYGGPATGPVGMDRREVKSIGELFLGSQEFKGRSPSGTSGAFQIDAADIASATGIEVKDLSSGSAGSVTHSVFGSVDRRATITIPQRATRVRDLFPQATTTAAMIEYVVDRGFVLPGDNAAAFVGELVADGSAYQQKPKSKINFEIETANTRTIAHWIPAHRNVLDDEPQLRSMIDQRLLYGLKLAEDRALLLGTGTGQEILGIYNTPGIQLYEGPAAGATTGVNAKDNYVDTLRRAITRVMLAEYEATGIVMHPLDWERTELTKGSDGQYVLVGNAAVGADQKVWRLPVVATAACPEGTALVGAFGLGAQVFDRQQANVRTSDSHAELFTANAIAILAEERLALCTYRPESLVKVHLVGGAGV